MPELPEVEIVRRELHKLRGGTIVRVVSDDRRITSVQKNVVGQVIRAVGRRGKWLRLELDDGLVFAHLGMTGDWTLRGPGDAALRFERVRMDVERRRGAGKGVGNGKITSARYTDPRRFGRFITTGEDIAAWRELGPDPLLEGIDEVRMLAILKTRKRAIKEVLLDQSLLAGVGNILAIEALWNAKIDPRTPARLMNAADVHAIAAGLRDIIERTLEYDQRMMQAMGERARGEVGAPFRIYGHAKEPCPRCSTTLRQIVQGGRGTTYCPGCQKRHWRA
jgi:formamidopyrimidine-DNA glycosylase